MSDKEHEIVDYEEVLNVLPDTFQSTWRNNPDVLIYLSELGALGLQSLVQEPNKLVEERFSILEQTQDLAFHNYKTFIQAAECSQKIFQDFNVIEKRLDSLVTNLPKFKEKCNEFSKDAQHINARWRQASLTLAKHPQLLEFLEMPQLMDNCVKGGYYDEALELAAYVKRLERKHENIPLIKSIVADVQILFKTMMTQLLAKLRTNIQLPECLKVIGYLRRMEVFSEAELRIKFLHARDAWFQQVIQEIDKSDPYQHVIKVIETSRIHLFDIITQYRAIFSDEDSLFVMRGETGNFSAIFQSWVTWKISWFLKVLENDISLDLGGRIDSVLAQCMYFGLSFSRVNIDFRSLLVPIFQKKAFVKFESVIENATIKFENSIESDACSSYTSTAFLVPSLAFEDSLHPPNSLLDYYSLAQYCNDVLTAFNELKLIASYALASKVTVCLEQSLNRLVKKLENILTQKKFMNDKENEYFVKLCSHLLDLISHFNKCLGILFSPEDISSILGMMPLEFKKVEYLCKLDPDVIIEPLKIFLPTKIEEDVGLTMNIKLTSEDTQKCENDIKDEILIDNIKNLVDDSEQKENNEVKSDINILDKPDIDDKNTQELDINSSLVDKVEYSSEVSNNSNSEANEKKLEDNENKEENYTLKELVKDVSSPKSIDSLDEKREN